jgi:heme exporter protein B
MSATVAEPRFIPKTLLLARKDLRIEARGRDTLPPMLAFSFAVTLLLAFTLPGDTRLASPVDLPVGTVVLADVLAGFLWVTVLFGGLIGFARTFEIERDDGAIDALLLVPLDRSGLFVAKALANLVFVAMVEIVLVPLFTVLFDIGLGGRWPTFVLVIVLVDLGLVAVGTLFASLAAQTRSRELILPILSLPVLVPIVIAAVELTSDLFLGGGLDAVGEHGWFGILIAFDAIALTAGALMFEFTIE